MAAHIMGSALLVFLGALWPVSTVAAYAPSPAFSVVPSFGANRPRQRWSGRPQSPILLSAAPSSVDDERVAKALVNGKQSPRKTDAGAPIDKVQLAQQTEEVPLGQLTPDHRRDMLTVMRQLSSMDRRRDDIVATSRKRRQDAAMVERLLDRLLREHQYSVEFAEDGKQSGQDVNARTYNLAIKAWANANVRGSAEKAERVLKKLKVANINEEKASTPASFLQPDLYSFAYTYAAWYKEAMFAAKNAENDKASSAAMRKAETVLQSMKQVLMRDGRGEPSHSSLNVVEDVNSLLVLWSNTNANLPGLAERFLRFVDEESKTTSDTWTNTRSYNLVINSWAKSGSDESVTRAEALLADMEDSSTLSPDLLTYSGVVSCLAQSKRGADHPKADAVLRRLQANGIQPDAVIYNQVMNIYSKQGTNGASQRCEKVLKQMESLASAGNEQVAPDVRTYNLLLSAYANEKGPAEAEKVISRMHMNNIKPNAVSFTTTMDAYAKIGDAHNSLRILSLMEKEYNNGNSDAKPTRRAYMSALNSLAKSGRGDAGTRAEALVQTMERMGLKPDTQVFNVLINCHKNSAARAEKVLYRMGERDVVSYSSVMHIHSTTGGVKAAKRAQELLDEMQKEDVEPNAHAFNSVITALSRSGIKNAAQKAEGLLKKMEALYEETGNANLQPSARVYTSVISAWAKSNEPGSALRAEILLKLMWAMYKRGNKAAKPNCHTFTSVINCWAKSRDKDAGERAEALLDQMIKLYEKGDREVKPNVLTLTAAIHAYARSGARDAASKVDSILSEMKAIGVHPSLQTSEHGKAAKAHAILKRMKDMHSQGVIADQANEFLYTAVINAAATTYGDEEEKQEAFRIAYRVFKEITDSERLNANHVTYSTFLRAISKLVPSGEKKDSLISAAFRLCIRDGQCDSNCLFHMKNGASQELVCDLLGCSDYNEANALSVDDFPLDWTRNVQQRSRGRIR
ncbi:hypothetical protein ACHAXT_000747 [Thalassiosira profunda]